MPFSPGGYSAAGVDSATSRLFSVLALATDSRVQAEEWIGMLDREVGTSRQFRT